MLLNLLVFLAGRLPVKILLLGDSITHGAGDTCEQDCRQSGRPQCSSCAQGWRGPLWRQLVARYGEGKLDFVGSQQNGPDDIDRDHEGHCGATLSDFDKLRSPFTPDVVLLLLGTNDLGWHGNLSQAYASLGSLLWHTRDAAAENATVLLSSLINGPTSFGQEKHAAWNAALPSVAAGWSRQGFDVRFVDMATEAGGMCSSENEGLCCPAKIHPTDAGYARMAGVWFTHLAHVIDEKLR